MSLYNECKTDYIKHEKRWMWLTELRAKIKSNRIDRQAQQIINKIVRTIKKVGYFDSTLAMCSSSKEVVETRFRTEGFITYFCYLCNNRYSTTIRFDKDRKEG